jgi:hypothetical protein
MVMIVGVDLTKKQWGTFCAKCNHNVHYRCYKADIWREDRDL